MDAVVRLGLVAGVKDVVIPFIIIAFKGNKDMLHAFSKIDDRNISIF